VSILDALSNDAANWSPEMIAPGSLTWTAVNVPTFFSLTGFCGFADFGRDLITIKTVLVQFGYS
jgi:hypothetical protein